VEASPLKDLVFMNSNYRLSGSRPVLPCLCVANLDMAGGGQAGHAGRDLLAAQRGFETKRLQLPISPVCSLIWKPIWERHGW